MRVQGRRRADGNAAGYGHLALNLLRRQWFASDGHGLQAADRRRINREGSRHVDQSLAISEPLQCFLPLVRCQLLGPAEPDALVHGALAAVIGAGADQMPLECRRYLQPGDGTSGYFDL